jgi:rhodanese-related sulfurtransferase
VTPEQLAEQLASGEPPVVLDVRTDEEWNAGHIPGAMHIPVQDIEKRKGEVPSDREVVVHCQVGPRARKAEEVLVAAGRERIFHLDGGFRAWYKAGLPVEE